MTTSSAELIPAEVEARILVVDDEPEIAAMVADCLRQADDGWQVEAESDPRRALARLDEEAYDCLVTDLVMPEMSGLSLAREAKARSANLALIAITGRATVEAGIEAIRLGFADMIQKPFNLEALQQCVGRTIHERRQAARHDSRLARLAQAKEEIEAVQAQTVEKLDIAGHDLTLSNRRMARQMEDMSLVTNVARTVMGVIELEDLLGLCAELIGDRVDCRTCTVALYEPQEAAIGLMVRAHPEAEDPPALCWLKTPIRSGFMVRAAQSAKSVHLDDVARSGLAHEQEREIWRDGRALAVPIPCENSSVAVAVLHRTTDDDDFAAHDIKRVGELVNVMGPAIRTAKTHHRQRCQIYAALESMADAMESRDPQRRGHSARVFAYAMPVTTTLELSQAQVGATQIAARLHDIGRIIIPDHVTIHAGPLTDAQWEIVRRHPEAGANLLKTLDFFGEVCQIIRAHHESYDGTGYPDLKAGEEIPIVARVIAVADAFDAMTSPRPYRQALSVDDAIEQVRRLAGQQFDPQVVDALVNTSPAVLRDIQGSWR